ncbi:helix-turn-helix domain-containing protein [Streptomyces mayteni]
MSVTEFSTEIVAPRDRFALFAQAAHRSHVVSRLNSDHRHDFAAGMRLLSLGELQLSALTFPQLDVLRTPPLIRRSDPEVFMVNCVVDGSGSVGVVKRDTGFGVGDILLLDSSRPYDGRFRPGADGCGQLVAQFPHRMLPLPEKALRRLLAVPLSGQRGLGGVLRRWMTDLHARADEFTPADLPALASVTMDLLAALFGQALDSEEALPPDSRRRALRRRVRDYVGRHLADPTLSPRTIAAAHHVSVRHLHQLFEEDGTTPAAWIRSLRLERCRRDLTDPTLDARPVAGIGLRWGFTDPAHFSRVFRAAYGMPPGAYRREARGTGRLARERTGGEAGREQPG